MAGEQEPDSKLIGVIKEILILACFKLVSKFRENCLGMVRHPKLAIVGNRG